MTVERIPALTINCPEFFERADFQNWLNQPASTLNGGARATWHQLGDTPCAMSDTFITHDNYDGSDYDELFPDDIQTAIRLACEAVGFSYGIIRLTNLDKA